MKKKPTFRVLSAKYGVTQERGADVTKAVQAAATPGGLVLKVSNANLGGIDPSPRKRKRLWVTYKDGTVKATGTSIEGTTLRLGNG